MKKILFDKAICSDLLTTNCLPSPMDTTTANCALIPQTNTVFTFQIGDFSYKCVFYSKTFQIIRTDYARKEKVILSSFYDRVYVAGGGYGLYGENTHPHLIGHEIMIKNGKQYVYVGKSICSFKLKHKITSFTSDIHYYSEKYGIKKSHTYFETKYKLYDLSEIDDRVCISYKGSNVDIHSLI